jgi:antitoxin (DNA-binding transcriptional repressor) of toxin-antitoxin stability system
MALALAWAVLLSIAAQANAASDRNPAPRSPAARAAAKAGYSLDPSSTEPYATCAQPKPGHVGCMSVVVPPGAIVSNARSARDVGRPKKGGRFAPLFDSEAPSSSPLDSGSATGEVRGLFLEGSGQEGGLSPADLRSAYRIPSSGGSGQAIAIVSAFDNPNAESDLKIYREHYGLPACTIANGCFRKVNQEGKTSNYPAPNASWAFETSLDLDMASAICPACKILLVEAKNAEWENMGKAVEKAATYTASGWSKASVISNSWGGIEEPPWWMEPEDGDKEEEEYFEELEKEYEEFELSYEKYITHPGTPVLFAGGNTSFTVNYPAASPNVVSVGGTNLYKAPHTERGWFEEAWIGSGSGCSRYASKPAWQTDTGCAKRMDNDVAAVASPYTAVSVYNSYQAPGWVVTGGTSAATPIVAGVEALSSAGFREEGAQAFWKKQMPLFDVTTGFNVNLTATEDCVPRYYCNAGPGYDGPTGNGTPNVEGGGEGLPRKWTNLPTPITESESYDISCTSSTFCMEVGTEDNFRESSGEEEFIQYAEVFASAKTWDGSEWTPTTDFATVPGGTDYELLAVSCITTTACTAVGRYRNEGGTRVTLVEAWDGTEWTVQSSPNPSEALSTELRRVSCSSSTTCVALGSTFIGKGWNDGLVYRWDGSEWSIESLPLPSGVNAASFGDVSCGSASFCAVSGHAGTVGSSGAGLIETWDGSKWSYQVIEPAKKVENPTYESSRLATVSCTSSSFCIAVGEYYYQWESGSGTSESLVEIWNGSTWTQKSGTSLSSKPILRDMSCTSASFCEAVGWEYPNSFSTTSGAVAARWNGTTWSIETLPRQSELQGSYLYGVSCTASASCIAVGTYRPTGYPVYGSPRTAASLKVSGSSLTLSPIVASTESKAVSCATETVCVAVGGGGEDKRHTASTIWNGGKWASLTPQVPAGASASSLSGVSCMGAYECEAVGSYVDSSGTRKTLAENASNTGHIRYMEWAVQSTPNPAGAKASSLSGVSCSSGSACTAVGTYTNSSGTQLTLAERWNGSEWSIQSTPNPAGFKSASLSGVSCPTSTSCTAVGTYTNSSGTQLTLAERWNGSEWSIQSTPNPAGAKASSLSGVSCSTSTSCTAVGTYTDEGGTQRTLAAYWNGTTWSIQTTPNPAGAKASSLSGVSCAGPGSCAAVGTYTDGSGNQLTLGENWNGAAWSIQSTPNPEAAKAVALNAVSCNGRLCMGTGTATSKGSVRTALAQARWGTGPAGVTTEAATFNANAEPQLNGTVNPDGLATSYRFEYGLTSAYGSAIPLSPKEIGSGKTPVKVTQTISESLKSGAKYHFRLAASNEIGSSYGADLTFATSPNLHWFACTEQTGGRYSSNKCATEGIPNKWESLKLKEGEKVNVTAKGNPIAVTATLSGVKGTLNCETEVTSASLENPSGGGNGTGAATLKYKGCKGESGWSSCTITPGSSVGAKAELANAQGKFKITISPQGANLGAFTFSGCSTGGINGTRELTGTIRGLYSNSATKAEFNAETTAEGLKLSGVSATAVGSIGLETTAGGYIKALGQPVVTTGAATSVKPSEATLNGTVNPEGANTHYQFEYGKTTSYGQLAPAVAKDIGEGLADVEVAETIAGLVPGTKYNYRLIATNGAATSYGLNKTFTTTALPMRWFACTEQTGGRFSNSKCSTESLPWKWESLKLKEGEKVNVTAKGNPIAFTASISGIGGSFSCATALSAASLENPSGGANGIGNAEIAFSGCKGEGGWSSCKVTPGSAVASKLELITIEGKTHAQFSPKEGTTFLNFTMAECSVAGTYKLVGTLRGFYNNVTSKIEFNAESTAEALRLGSPVGPKVTAVGSVGLETTAGGYVKALGQPVVTTGAATSVKPTEATLNGTVNPEGANTHYQFEYGKTTSYGQLAPVSAKNVGEGLTDVEVAETIAGLVPGTKYHYRLIASNGTTTSYGLDKTFTTTAVPMHWLACTEQAEGKYATSACEGGDFGPPNEWELTALKEGEKVNVTAKGNPIAFTSSIGGMGGSFSCATAVSGSSLENPSGGANGIGNAEIAFSGCKGEGGWSSCKVTPGSAVASKLELATLEGKTYALISPKEGTTFYNVTFAECAVAGTYKLVGTLRGFYSNANSKIEFNAESTAEALRVGSVVGPKVTAVGSIGLETSAGGYIRGQ